VHLAGGVNLNLYEYEAKQIFANFGILVPPSLRIEKADEVKTKLSSAIKDSKLNYPLTLKCQVLTGGRGKAGGIKFAKDLSEAESTAANLLKLKINDLDTQSLLIEPKLDIAQELYLAITLDRNKGCAIFIASAEGGIEIESSHNVVTSPIPYPYHSYVARDLAYALGLKGNALVKVADIANKLYKLFIELDLDLAEINPLIITKSGEVMALDGKVIVNDDAIDRQPYFKGWLEKHLDGMTVREQKSKMTGLNLVELKGNIGILCNGAGLTMATMDMVKAFGGEPANFLDAGGGSDQAKTLAALEIVQDNPEVKVILLNILGGITACDEVARALVEFVDRHPKRNIVVRLRGNNQELAEQILAERNVKLFPNIEDAVKEAVSRSK
jgi:succinyl-CoA synthetase beta subunit